MTFVNAFNNYFPLSYDNFTKLMTTSLFNLTITQLDLVPTGQTYGLKWYTLSAN